MSSRIRHSHGPFSSFAETSVIESIIVVDVISGSRPYGKTSKFHSFRLLRVIPPIRHLVAASPHRRQTKTHTLRSRWESRSSGRRGVRLPHPTHTLRNWRTMGCRVCMRVRGGGTGEQTNTQRKQNNRDKKKRDEPAIKKIE